MRSPNLSKKRRDQLRSELRIAADKLEPIDLEEVAARYGLNPNSIRGIASRSGIPIRVAGITLLERIMAVASVQKTRDDVARELGERPELVQRAYRHAKDQGIHVPQRGRALHASWLKAQLKSYKLPPEVEAWLIVQLPESNALPDLIRAIILDAYHEEKGQ